MQDIESILRNSTVTKETKAVLWDIFQGAKNEDEIADRLSGMDIPKDLKASIWDAKLKSVESVPAVGLPQKPPLTLGQRALGYIAEEGPPIIGAVGGGILGTMVAGPGPGTIGGAAMGAASARTLQNIMKPNPPASFGAAMADVGKAAAMGGLQEFGAAYRPSKYAAEYAAGMKEKAEKTISNVLKPTKEPAKNITERQLAGGILKRRIFAGSRSALQEKAEIAADKASAELDKAWAAIPKTVSMSKKTIINALKKARAFYVVDGVDVAPEATAQLDNIIAIIEKFGNHVSPQSLRRTRQIWDVIVSRSGGYWGKEISEGSALYAKREAANAIRNELAKKFPDIAKINSEFNFWQNLSTVLGKTATRTQSQERSLGEQIITGAAATGGLTGMVLGGEPVEYGLGAALLIGLNKLVRSSGYKIVSAQTRNAIADLIGSGKLDEAAAMVNRMLVRGPELLTSRSETPAEFEYKPGTGLVPVHAPSAPIPGMRAPIWSSAVQQYRK